MSRPQSATPFSEREFYLQDFRGRTLAFAVPAQELSAAEPLVAVLEELSAHASRSVVVSSDAAALEKLVGRAPLPAEAAALPGRAWRALRAWPVVGIASAPGAPLWPAAGRVAQRLGLTKLVCLDPAGGVCRAGGVRASFIDLDELQGGVSDPRVPLLREIRRLLEADFPAVNLCSQAGLADELFTYSGSGTLFTCRDYVAVRRLGLDDYDAAADLIARGVEEGFLAPRSEEEIDAVLATGVGAFVDGVHLAGIGALLPHASGRSGEIASLYTLTRFVGEGVGGHLVRFALEEARRIGMDRVFACTTSERVGSFFEREGFARVEPEALPDEKWRAYDAARKARLLCLVRSLA
jgi:amino-acid N-acetyltransferase